MILPYWLAAAYLPILPHKIKMLLDHFNSIEKLFKASEEEYLLLGLSPKIIDALLNPNWELIENDLAWAEKDSLHHVISYEDPRYPAMLKEIPDPPLIMYVKGDPLALSTKQLGIVGGRAASFSGNQTATQFAQYLAQAGMTITSGLALGIDGAAHRGALLANGRTIAVMGTGLHFIYPHSHLRLAEEIIEKEGALVSEFPLDTAPVPRNFPRRNRIISGMSLGVLVVEAALKSGSLITARHALEQGRDVFAIPGSIHQPLSRGCHALIRQGAKLVETAADIFEELFPSFANVTLPPKTMPAIPEAPESRELLSLIGYEIVSMDVLLYRSGLTVSELSAMLLTLELKGYIQAVSGGYIRSITGLG